MSNTRNDQCHLRLLRILPDLPDFVKEYISNTPYLKTGQSKYHAALNIRSFLTYISINNGSHLTDSIHNLSVSALAPISMQDISDYCAYLVSYEHNGRIYHNTTSSIRGKLITLYFLYDYCIKENLLVSNPIQRKMIHYSVNLGHTTALILTKTEKQKLIQTVLTGDALPAKVWSRNQNVKYRNSTILLLLINYHLRSSEISQLNLVDLSTLHDSPLSYQLRIENNPKRKDSTKLILNEPTSIFLHTYLAKERSALEDLAENALFLSGRGRRIAMNTIDHMVSTYTSTLNREPPITSGRLRTCKVI